jgi:pectate lyase
MIYLIIEIYRCFFIRRVYKDPEFALLKEGTMKKRIVLILIFLICICGYRTTDVACREIRKQNKTEIMKNTVDPEEYIKAVKEFCDNVLKYGRDKYGPKHSPLFVDGIEIETKKPARYGKPILSNLASQQNLLRTLCALSAVTGEEKYRQAAKECVAYAFEHVQDKKSGLLNWGGHNFYDVEKEKPFRKTHELKFHYPFYQFLWEVNPEKTKKFIEAFWKAHIYDWSNLAFNRHGNHKQAKALAGSDVWSEKYTGGKVPFVLPNKATFQNTGSDLFYSVALLSKFIGDDKYLVWSKRLARRYVEIRDPKTGLGGNMFNITPYSNLADVSRVSTFGICQLRIYEMLGDKKGKEFLKWAIEDMKAWTKYCYEPKDNTYKCVWINGKELTKRDRETVKEYGYDRRKAGISNFYTFAIGYKLSKDIKVWKTVRSIGKGCNLGDIGTPDKPGALKMNTKSDSIDLIFALLELYKASGHRKYLELAKKAGDNCIKQSFNYGLFAGKNAVYCKFNSRVPLALIHLYAALKNIDVKLPVDMAAGSYYHGSFKEIFRGYDSFIWSQTKGEAERLSKVLNDPDENKKFNAAKRLVQLTAADRTDVKVIEKLYKSLKDNLKSNNYRIREKFIDQIFILFKTKKIKKSIIKDISFRILKILEKHLSYNDKVRDKQAIVQLFRLRSYFKNDKILELLFSCLKREGDSAWIAAQRLGSIARGKSRKDRKVVMKRAMDIVKDKAGNIKERELSLYTLSMIEDKGKKALPLVKKITLDKNEPTGIRQTAAFALVQIAGNKDKDFMKIYKGIIENDSDKELRIMAIQTLGGILPPAPGVFETIKRCLNDKDKKIRGEAVKAVKRLEPYVKSEKK